MEENKEEEKEIIEVGGHKIETVEIEVGQLKHDFGNPRKIKASNKQELEQSLEQFGDFGLFLIDENNNVIAGNQRSEILNAKDPKTKVLCKRLIGYSEAELRAINIKDNVHAGEWDLEKLADWTADLNIDLGIDLDTQDPNGRSIPEMELVHFEKYDYVLIACRNELDYNDLVRKLGIEGAKVAIATRHINARAIWYDQLKVTLVNNEELKRLKANDRGLTLEQIEKEMEKKEVKSE